MGTFYLPEKNDSAKNNFIITSENTSIVRMLAALFSLIESLMFMIL